MIDQAEKKSFVQGWTEAQKNDHPGCEIVGAIARFTAKDELDEAKLVAALREMIKAKARAET